MDKDSLRVEGHGPAIIHDVNLKEKRETTKSSKPRNNPLLNELRTKKASIEKAESRCTKSRLTLDDYVAAAKPWNTKHDEFVSVMDYYEVTAAQLDEKLLDLERELKEIDRQIKELSSEEREGEKKQISFGFSTFGQTVRIEPTERTASIGVVAESDSDVELILIYAVHGATWRAAYDLRIDTTKKDKPVTLIYKAVVSQSTGESWDNISLTLDTGRPTWGFNLPSLKQWSLKPRPVQTAFFGSGSASPSAFGSTMPAAGSGLFGSAPTSASMSMIRGAPDDRDRERERDCDRQMEHTSSTIASQGSVSANFKIPGSVTVPSAEGERSFTIATLELDALMAWLSIPKVDNRVHLKANIHNDSDYTLLVGTASIYVDGSYIMKSDLPVISPKERFECSLGLDPSIRVTYHALSKKAATSGFYQKSTIYVYTQRVTIQNTKTSAIPFLKIIDQIPVPEHSEIKVKIVSPALKDPSADVLDNAPRASNKQGFHTSLSEVIAATAGLNVEVADGIIAVWDGADEPDADLRVLGKNGKMNWLCEVAAKEKLNLILQWEVSVPQNMDVIGL
ncbi:mucoidy inhibitor a [Moniliophthora roreri]|nr:mucoidy inhibitor a [Moniliophthora roreri]